jgi:hypothetical protein
VTAPDTDALEAELAALRREHRAALAELRRLRAACELPPSRKEAAAALGIGERTLARWRAEGLNPAASLEEITAWKRHKVAHRKPSKRSAAVR